MVIMPIMLASSFIIAAAAWALTVVHFADPIGEALGLMDHPKAQAHKAHDTPTPLVGGLAAIPPAIMALTPWALPAVWRGAPELWAIAAATCISFVIGLSDDRRHIPAVKRLIMSGLTFGAAIFMAPSLVVSAITVNYYGWVYPLGWMAVPFTLICLLAFQNAVNMADGRNGLVTGLSIIWVITLLSYGPHPADLALAVLLAGMVVVWIANLKGRLFLGDAGSYGLGALIGLLVIWYHHSNVGMQTTQVVTILLIPVLDMIRLFMQRLRQGQHPFSADHSHLHHYLDAALGWSWGRLVYYCLVALPIVALRTELLPGLHCIAFGAALYAITLAVSVYRFSKSSAAPAQLQPGAATPLGDGRA